LSLNVRFLHFGRNWSFASIVDSSTSVGMTILDEREWLGDPKFYNCFCH